MNITYVESVRSASLFSPKTAESIVEQFEIHDEQERVYTLEPGREGLVVVFVEDARSGEALGYFRRVDDLEEELAEIPTDGPDFLSRTIARLENREPGYGDEIEDRATREAIAILEERLDRIQIERLSGLEDIRLRLARSDFDRNFAVQRLERDRWQTVEPLCACASALISAEERSRDEAGEAYRVLSTIDGWTLCVQYRGISYPPAKAPACVREAVREAALRAGQEPLG